MGVYWANTSFNRLVGRLLQEGSANVKKNAIWSLLLASGYLKVVDTTFAERQGRTYYKLMLTNREVHIMFESMILDWFSGNDDYNDFIKALLMGDVKAMNTYMNRVTQEHIHKYGFAFCGKEVMIGAAEG